MGLYSALESSDFSHNVASVHQVRTSFLIHIANWVSLLITYYVSSSIFILCALL
jgi:hypothetical protein